MAHEKILIIEDEKDILELIAFNLECTGYTVYKASNGEDGIEIVKNSIPDLILLDLMMPGIDGFDVCKILKQDKKTKHIPIIMLTARGEDTDIVSGLEIGADDYVTKPFSPKILIARIRTVLRRPNDSPEVGETLNVSGIIMDISRHRVSIDSEEIDLSSTEFDILKTLMSSPGWVFSRNQIIDAVKGSNYPVTQRSVDVQILGLRKKLGTRGQFIETVRGVGYKLKEVK
ncbi:response regulator [Thiospirochaeta perfilievii]|uniref:Response regulator n=1 Tax=Thiospirochaeta perfilievii TaxID=252967 RepID=A0A5C1QE89_9SPIO|nr:response regulator [Thiospirochaeta perfilievii]QEN05034.1 response regulator [Thiospirochaeta perfilievii]